MVRILCRPTLAQPPLSALIARNVTMMSSLLRERPRAQSYICCRGHHVKALVFILSVPTSSTARILETAGRKMKGVMAGTRPRASTLSDNVFTVSHFSLRRASGHAALGYRTAATEDDSGLWVLDQKERRKRSNRAVEMSPRRPEVGRIGGMHSLPK